MAWKHLVSIKSRCVIRSLKSKKLVKRISQRSAHIPVSPHPLSSVWQEPSISCFLLLDAVGAGCVGGGAVAVSEAGRRATTSKALSAAPEPATTAASSLTYVKPPHLPLWSEFMYLMTAVILKWCYNLLYATF